MTVNKNKSRRGGTRAGAGRKKGIPNRLTTSMKEAIRDAFQELGGAGYLVRIGHDDPRTFCSLLGRVIPREVGGPDGEPIKVQDVSDLELARRLGFILARGGDDVL